MAKFTPKQELRQAMRDARREITNQKLQLASDQLARTAARFAPLRRAKRLASYRAFAGEVDPRPLERQLNASIYLPRITNFRLGKMQFYIEPVQSQTNSLGISEPLGLGQPMQLTHCDLVLLPLVAFQRDGARLGMGSGFYDRALSFRHNRHAVKRPLLIGLAHDFQETDQLQSEPWDVSLNAIITNRELIII